MPSSQTQPERDDLMEPAQRPTPDRADDALPSGAWPAFIRTKVYYGPEDDHWYAIDADFDIATMGATADEALVSLQHMIGAYLKSHLHEGGDLASARRPIPLKQRVKLHTVVLLAKPMRALRRRTDLAQEGDFLIASLLRGC